ncbi:uncharacterized protein LOC133327549 [Musca vetustissima]|uniref:uncharacterized protein LOC133327549 n=1 Tax=Musca vetustissima TaxID=27455 RepID=UPI002AB69D19|nr:uncharacterized protein LOC133327549 [Musca vetustissima]
MKFYATCQYKCGADNNLQPTASTATTTQQCTLHNCHLGHEIMATGDSGDQPADNTTTNSPSSLYSSSCPQLTQYRSLPRNLYSAIRKPLTLYGSGNGNDGDSTQHQLQQQSLLCGGTQPTTLRTSSEQELRRSSAFDKGHRRQLLANKKLILCNKSPPAAAETEKVEEIPPLLPPKKFANPELPTKKKSSTAADHIQTVSSATAAAFQTERILCENCRFNDQPVVWWVSCPRLAHQQQGSTQSLKEYTNTTAQFLAMQQQQQPLNANVNVNHNHMSVTTNTATMLPKPVLKPSSTTGVIPSSSAGIPNPGQQSVMANQSYSKATITTASAAANTLNTNASTIASTATPSPPPPPVIRPHHHRSISGLSGLDLYDNYGVGGGGSSTHVPSSNYGSTCRRHTKQQQQLLTQQQQYHTHHPHPQQHLLPSHQQHQQQQYSTCCSSYNIDHKMQTPSCMCGKLYHQQVTRAPRETLAPPPSHHHVGMHAATAGAAAAAANTNRGCNHNLYYGPDSCVHQFEDQDSGFPGLRDQEFYLLHRNIPALRRTGVDTTGIRQHFYPDGGWGWIICGMSFLIHILTTGLQLSYGLTLFYAVHHIRNASGNEWLGALSWSISMLVAPFVETLCRRKSTRLLAVVGGLVLSLGILFTSFATEVDQVIFSYGFVFGIGVSMVRETSTIMLGNYFKKRRLFVEMVAMSGEGVGIALFSVLLKEGVGKMGWRSGLQIVAALTSISFFVGLLYRPASLYHPQRRAIQHLKNQRKKLRDHKTNNIPAEPNIIKKIIQDISNLKSGTVKILLLTSAVAALGIYTPMFTMSLNAAKEGSDVQELVLLQTMLGMSTTLGVVLAGVLIRRPFVVQNFVISTPIISQVFLAAVALSILFMSFMMGYKSLCILSGIYGVGFGGFRFSLKMLVLEKVKLKFSKTWSFIRGIEAIPVLISVPLTIFLNDYSPKYGRAGYYICSAAAAIAAIIIFFIGYSSYSHQNPSQRSQENGSIVPAAPRLRSMSTQYVRNKYQPAFTVDYPKSNGCDYPAPDLLNRSCISLNQLGESASCLCGPVRNMCNYHTPLHQRRHCGALANLPQNQLQHHHMAAGGGGDLDDHHHHRYPYVYDNGTGSYLRRSLSFIQNANCCGANQFQLQCQANVQWSHRDLRMDSTQPLLCTCSPSSYFSNCKSQSVPEGLSTMSQQCKCKPTSQPSREYIYVPRHHQQALLPPSSHNLQSTSNHNCSCHNLQKLAQSSGNSNLVGSKLSSTGPAAHQSATMPKCKLKRSQSLSRPMTYVEQMTTSV